MIIKFQPPCCVQGHHLPDQAAQSHIQPGLECLQGLGIHSLLGQPVSIRTIHIFEKETSRKALCCKKNCIKAEYLYAEHYSYIFNFPTPRNTREMSENLTDFYITEL